MHKNAMKCKKTQSKWCINKHGASKIIDTFETYQWHRPQAKSRHPMPFGHRCSDAIHLCPRILSLTEKRLYKDPLRRSLEEAVEKRETQKQIPVKIGGGNFVRVAPGCFSHLSGITTINTTMKWE
jgi:hypothetical protein